MDTLDQVLEIDGPPQASVVVDGQSLHYRTIACLGDSEESVRAWLNERLDMVRAACRAVDAQLIWRARPTVQKRPGRGKRWIARARLVTSRPISEDVWKAMAVAEGAPVEHIAV